MARSSTFTTYVRSELDPRTGTAYRQLETIANRTYESIARGAANATRAGSQVGNVNAGGGAAAASAARAYEQTAAAQARASSAANDNARTQRRSGLAMAEAAAATGGLQRNLSTLSTTLNVVQGPLGPLAGRIRSISAAMTELTGLRFGLAGVGASLFVFTKVASDYTNIQNRLRPLFETQQQFNLAFGDVIGIANRSRQALGPLAELYSRITIGGRDIGLSQSRIGRITEIAAKAATLSGGSADIQQRGLVQFSQGLGRGVLQGQDLKAVLEDIPILGKAIAAGFKNADGSIGTTIGRLRDLGSEGKLTGLAIADALERADPKIVSGPFAKLPITIGAGISKLENSFGQIVGRINDSTGATEKLGGSLVFVADHLRTLTSLASGLAGAFVAPRVLSYLADVGRGLDAALTRRIQLAEVVAGTGNVTPINAPAPVRALGVARNAADDANAVNQQAQVAVAATRAKVVALEEEGAAYRSNIAIIRQQIIAAEQASAETIAGTSAATDAILAEAAARRLTVNEIQEEAATAHRASAQALADSEARVAALRVEAEQAAANQALVAKQAASAASAKATRAGLNAQGLSFVGVGAKDQAALETSIATGRAEVLMRQQQTIVAGELGAAERKLAADRNVEAAAAERQAAADGAATLSQSSAAVLAQNNLLAKSNLLVRANARELAKANVFLTETYGAATVASAGAAAAAQAVSVAERAATVATSLFSGALNLLKASVPFLLISGLVTVVTYLASAESKAAEGARELGEAQQTMGKFIDTTTGKIVEQNKALVQGELIKVRGTVETNRAGFKNARQLFIESGAQSIAGVGEAAGQSVSTGLPTNISRLVSDVANNVRGSAGKLDTALTSYSKTSESAARTVDIIRTRQAAAVTALRTTNSAEAYGQALQGRGTPTTARLAGGDFNRPGTVPREASAARSAAQVKAAADAAAANTDLQKAVAAREKVVADGAAARTAGKFNEEEYSAALTEATQNVYRAREAQKALNAARRDGGKAAGQARRNEGDVARDAAQQARDSAQRQLDAAQQGLEERRPNISRQQYLDDRVKNLGEYDAAINKANAALAAELTRINGNRSASGKQAAESHKAADQQVADARDVGAARRESATAFERDVATMQLRLRGQDNEAAALGTTLALVERIGDAGYAEYQNTVRQNRVEELLNAKLSERQRLTDTLRGSVGNIRESVTGFLADLTTNAPQAVADLGKNLLSGFQKSAASLAADSLLSGADQQIKDLVSGKSAVQSATDFAAVQFSRTGTAAANLSSAFESARNFVLRLVGQTPGVGSSTPNVTTTGVPSTPGGIDAGILTSGASLKSLLNPQADATGIIAAVAGLAGATRMLSKSSGDLADGKGIGAAVATAAVKAAAVAAPAAANDNGLISGAIGSPTDANGDIVVTAQKAVSRAFADPGIRASLPGLVSDDQKNKTGLPSLRDVYNETGRSIGDRLDNVLGTKFLGKVGNKLGDALGGAGKGTLASSLASAIGLKGQSQTGAALGGAAGGVLGGIKGITSALGPFGAALSPVLGILGGALGGLFSKAKVGATSITSAGIGATTGNNAAAQAAAKASAGVVLSGITSLVDQLHGAGIGDFGTITVGKYKDKFRVNDHGTNIKSNNDVLQFDSEAEATAFALWAAVSRGAVKGISEASQRILTAGKNDLEAAANKAAAIENIPRQLLQITDPVKYAVTVLNESFAKLISYLNEGGASASQYADAQKLYELQRSQAIEQATNQASEAITNFLADLNNSTSSPLNKLTVYENASAALSNFRTDITAGKAVDSTQLLAAAKNFNDASRAINGSGSAFFDDFNSLQALLSKAKSNITGSATDASSLPSSPFSTDATAAAALGTMTNAQVNATNNQTKVLSDKLDQLISATSTIGDNYAASYVSPSDYSSLGLLPGFSKAA